MLHWITRLKGLREIDLTVRAQAIAASNPDTLVFEAFFRRTSANSMKIAEATGVDFRPLATHRPWNAEPAPIAELSGPIREASFIPLASSMSIGEEEMQDLYTKFSGNEAVYGNFLMATLPSRLDHHVKAVKRSQQLQAFHAWLTGQIRIVNPQKEVVTVGMGFDAARYETAPSAWNASGINAYNELEAFVLRAKDMGIAPIGVALSTRVLRKIQADAPQNLLIPGGRQSIGNIQTMIADAVGIPGFTFVTNDQTYHTGNNTSSSARYWPISHVAIIPAGRYVGESRYAPVVRASQMAAVVPEAKIVTNDVTVFYEGEQGGKLLKVETQLNAFPWPDEQRVHVINTGITS